MGMRVRRGRRLWGMVVLVGVPMLIGAVSVGVEVEVVPVFIGGVDM